MPLYWVEMFGRQHFVYATDKYEAIRKVAKRYTAKIPRWWIKIRVARNMQIPPETDRIRQIDGNIEIESLILLEEEERRRREEEKRKRTLVR